MCNLYSLTRGQQAIRDFTRVMRGDVGNVPPLSRLPGNHLDRA